MSNKKRTNTNKSLCEKSMKMMVNFIRLSSLSIATMSLGTPNSVPTTRTLSSTNFVGVEEPLLPQIPGGRRSQEPRGSCRPIKVVMAAAAGEENNNTTSSYVVDYEEKKSGVDGRADDYIRKVHEKNRKNGNDWWNHDVVIIPPSPPRILK